MSATGGSGKGGVVRVGVVGYGLGGSTFHAPFVDALPELSLVAIVTTDPDRQAAIAARYPDTAVVGSVDELLARDDLDLVVVTTPNQTHGPIATASLRSGRHVVVDKPVAPTVGEARALRDVAEAAGKVCIPFHNRRWDGDFLTVRDLVGRGRLGSVERFEARWERWRPDLSFGPGREWKDDPAPGAAGGVHFDLGPHLLDQALVLLGRPVTVYAELATRRPGARAIDDAHLALTFAGGAVAHVTVSLTVGQALPRYQVVGTDATYIGVTTLDPQEAALGAGRSPTEPGWGEVDAGEWGTLGAGDAVEAVPTLAGDYAAFYRGVVATVLDGAPPPVTIDDGIAVLQVLDAAVRSSAAGSVVHLDG